MRKYMPANIIFDDPITNLLLRLHFNRNCFTCSCKGTKKALMISNLAPLVVVFWVTAPQAWQWKGWIWQKVLNGTHFPSSSCMAGAVPAFLASSSSFIFFQSSRDCFCRSPPPADCSDRASRPISDGGKLSWKDMMLMPVVKPAWSLLTLKTAHII